MLENLTHPLQCPIFKATKKVVGVPTLKQDQTPPPPKKKTGKHQPTNKPASPGPLTQGNGWQCPTLPQPTSCSTISAERLNFQVRKGYWV